MVVCLFAGRLELDFRAEEVGREPVWCLPELVGAGPAVAKLGPVQHILLVITIRPSDGRVELCTIGLPCSKMKLLLEGALRYDANCDIPLNGTPE